MISSMRTRNLLAGVILGLLAIVHSSPINSVTQISIKVEDEVLREAETDGFLVHHFFQPSLMTESPKKNMTVQVPTTSSQSTMQETATPTTPEHISVSHMVEPTRSSNDVHDADSGPGDVAETSTAPSTSTAARITHTTIQLPKTEELGSRLTEPGTTPSATMGEANLIDTQGTRSIGEPSMTPSATTGVDTEGSGLSEGPSTRSLATTGVTMSADTEGSGLSEGPSTTTLATTGVTMFADTEGSGLSEGPSTRSLATTGVTMSADTEGSGLSEGTSSVSSSSTTTVISTKIIQYQLNRMLPNTDSNTEVSATPENANHQTTLTTTTPPTNLAQHGNGEVIESGNRTPGWIIIVAFVVGVAGLVLLCVAIATREKWNGPRQPSQVETKNGTLSQQREVEMETFLHKEEPRENGKGGEGYTVIPLDELPQNHSMQ